MCAARRERRLTARGVSRKNRHSAGGRKSAVAASPLSSSPSPPHSLPSSDPARLVHFSVPAVFVRPACGRGSRCAWRPAASGSRTRVRRRCWTTTRPKGPLPKRSCQTRGGEGRRKKTGAVCAMCDASWRMVCRHSGAAQRDRRASGWLIARPRSPPVASSPSGVQRFRQQLQHSPCTTHAADLAPTLDQPTRADRVNGRIARQRSEIRRGQINTTKNEAFEIPIATAIILKV